VEVDVLEDGSMGRAAVPSGASTGEHEALELRDGDKARFLGKGVLKAVQNVNNVIAAEVVGLDALEQVDIDHTMIELDGTETKSKLGANAILGCPWPPRARRGLPGGAAFQVPGRLPRVADARAHGEHHQRGAHADSSVDFQEFMIMPVGAPSIREAVRMMAEIFHTLKGVLKGKGYNTGVGDEGGYAPSLKSNDEAVEVILQAIEKAGYKPGDHVMIASTRPRRSSTTRKRRSTSSRNPTSGSCRPGRWWISGSPGRAVSIISMEDAMAEDDWTAGSLLTEKLGRRSSSSATTSSSPTRSA